MLILDTALSARERDGKPIRVGIVGAGFMARGLANQLANSARGIRLAAISNRRVERARDAFDFAGRDDAVVAESQASLDAAIESGKPVATSDALLLARCPHIDALVEVTGSVEFAAHVLLEAFRHGKHVLLMNAELDGTIGPILQTYAARHGVVLSAADGDEPAMLINLLRWVKGIGMTPRLLGNAKGLQDRYRTPATQQAYAEQWGQNVQMVTSFADGTKINFEQAIVANASGFGVLSRGMSRGRPLARDVTSIGMDYDLDALRRLGGAVDYVTNSPTAKIFCLAEHPDPKQQHYLNYYKMGAGPLYTFFVPYHIVHFEVQTSIARAALFGDAPARPAAGPVVEVCAVAKRDLVAGEVCDRYGMYMTYGEAVNTDEMETGRYMPVGLVDGCRLVRDVPKDQVVTYGDVALPQGRLADRLRAEQYRRFRGVTWLADLVEPR